MVARRKNFTKRQVRILFVGVFLLYVAVSLFEWLVMSPWAVPFGGRKTLTGDWVGTATYGSGDRQTVALHLGYDMYRHKCGGGGCTSIGGELRACDASGTLVADASGKPKERSGRSFRLILVYGENRPAGRYQQLHDIDEAGWQGDRIVLRTRYNTQNADGTSVRRPEELSYVTVELHRVSEDEYERTCPV